MRIEPDTRPRCRQDGAPPLADEAVGAASLGSDADRTESVMAAASFAQRIVCLTEETTETLYLLEEDWRIAGISGFTVRPPRARREKPKVSAFTSAKIDRICELQPDLVLGFSDLQADIAADLIRRGLAVHVFNHRDIAGIFRMIRTLGGLIGCERKAAVLCERLEQNLARIRAVGRSVRSAAARLLRGMGRPDDLLHPLGVGADRDRRRRGLLRRPGAASAREKSHHCRRGRGRAPFAGHHSGVLVRQEVSGRRPLRRVPVGARFLQWRTSSSLRSNRP